MRATEKNPTRDKSLAASMTPDYNEKPAKWPQIDRISATTQMNVIRMALRAIHLDSPVKHKELQNGTNSQFVRGRKYDSDRIASSRQPRKHASGATGLEGEAQIYASR